jgi:RNA polymerase sigma-70 factor (ECF subfamily)
MTDSELIEKLKAKDDHAVRHLVITYQDKVVKTAFYILSNMEDAEDLSQEVFLEILRSLGQFKSKATLNTWIYRITVNKSLDHLRKQKRRSIIQSIGSFFRNDSENLEKTATEEDGCDSKEKRRVIDGAVNSLPENQKIAFILGKYEELSYKEIAGIMNISVPSVESLIHRAKLNLQKKLVKYFSEYGTNGK